MVKKKIPITGGKTVDETLKSIRDKFGKESVMILDESPNMDVEAIPTGSFGLDLALGIGGFPKGRLCEISGPESSGKTTLALHTIAEAQKTGGLCAFIDAEHALDPLYAKKIGVDTGNLLVSQPENGEQALQLVEAMVRSNKFAVIVIDSVASLTPKAEIDGEMGDQIIGRHAKLMSQACRKLVSIVNQSNTVILFINQIRMNIGVTYGCLHADTLINFTDGRSLPIKKVVDDKIEGDVWSFNNKGKIVSSPIIDWHNNGNIKNKTDFIHIQTDSINSNGGRFGITVTPNHKVLTSKGWQEAKELKKGDLLVSKYTQKINGTLADFLWGTLIGDSHIHIRDKKTGNLRFQDNQNPDYLNWKLNKIKNFIDFKKIKCSRGYRYESTYSYEWAKIKKESNRNPEVMLNDYYSDLGLAIWFMDDGCRSGNSGVISIKRLKNNKESLNDIKNILKIKTGLNVKINLKDGSLKFNTGEFHNLCQRICKYIPDSMQYKLVDEFKSKYKEFHLKNNEVIKTEYVKIQLIREASPRQIRQKGKYDISIKNTHNYMAGGKDNGVIVHNSNEFTTGGKALKFYSSVRLDIRRIAQIKKGDEVVGGRTRVKVVKNKVAPPFKQTEFDLLYGEGISYEGELIALGDKYKIITKSGNTYSFQGQKLGVGYDASRKYLKENKNWADAILKEIKDASNIYIPTDIEVEDNTLAEE